MDKHEPIISVSVGDGEDDDIPGKSCTNAAVCDEYDDEDDDDFDEDDDDEDHDNDTSESMQTATAAATASSSTAPQATLPSQQVPSIPKSYVSVLNEIASRRREPLTYELLKAEGFSHQPMFVYKVRMGETSVTGEGRRKKEARQDAARNLLVRIGTNFEEEEEETAALASKSLTILDDARCRGWTPGDGDAPASKLEEILAGSLSLVEGVGENKGGHLFGGQPTPIPPCKMHNPVGSVQEMTMFMRWPPPQFKIERQSGPPHDAIFTMACFVWDQKTVGTGKSKKEAKRLSALSMYNYLRYNPNVIREWRLREGMAYSSMYQTQDIKKVRSTEMNARRLQHAEMSEHRDKPSMQRLIKITDVFNLAAYDQYNMTPLDLLQTLANDYQFNIAFEDVQVDAVLPPEPERGDPLWVHLLGIHDEMHHAEKNKSQSKTDAGRDEKVAAGSHGSTKPNTTSKQHPSSLHKEKQRSDKEEKSQPKSEGGHGDGKVAGHDGMTGASSVRSSHAVMVYAEEKKKAQLRFFYEGHREGIVVAGSDGSTDPGTILKHSLSVPEEKQIAGNVETGHRTVDGRPGGMTAAGSITKPSVGSTTPEGGDGNVAASSDSSACAKHSSYEEMFYADNKSISRTKSVDGHLDKTVVVGFDDCIKPCTSSTTSGNSGDEKIAVDFDGVSGSSSKHSTTLFEEMPHSDEKKKSQPKTEDGHDRDGKVAVGPDSTTTNPTTTSKPPAAPTTRRVWCSTIRLSTKFEIHEFGTGLTKQAARERACLAVLQYIKLHTYEKFSEFAHLTLINYLKMPWKEVEAYYDRIKNRHFDGTEDCLLNSCTTCAAAAEAKFEPAGVAPKQNGNKTAEAKNKASHKPLCFDMVPNNRGGCEAWSVAELERYLEQDPFEDASIERFLDLERLPLFDDDL